MNPSTSHRGAVAAIGLLLVVLLLGLYVGSYAALVRQGPVILLEQELSLRDDYHLGGEIARGCYRPINAVDRQLRPEYWKSALVVITDGEGSQGMGVSATDSVQQAIHTETPAIELPPLNEVAPAAGEETSIELTPRAAERVRELIAKEPSKSKLRVSLVEKFGGDVHWNINLTGKVDPFDDTTCVSQGITIVVDGRSQAIIQGTQVDYLMQPDGKGAFVFDSPRLKKLR